MYIFPFLLCFNSRSPISLKLLLAITYFATLASGGLTEDLLLFCLAGVIGLGWGDRFPVLVSNMDVYKIFLPVNRGGAFFSPTSAPVLMGP